MPNVRWLSAPEEQNYPAAASYLNLVFNGAKAAKYVERLRKKPLSQFKAKDLFRASGLPLLGISNAHIQKDQKKIRAGKRLSPLLIVRDERNRKAIIADGYHRLCAVYSFNEDAVIPCKIV